MTTAANARSEELNTACRDLVTICRDLIATGSSPAQLHTSTGAELIKKVRGFFADRDLTDMELVSIAAARVGYLERRSTYRPAAS